MKIGVFGDSYANKRANPSEIWWGILGSNFDHNIDCYGESASSIMFSAKKVLEYYKEYDLVIWCLTQSGRKTVSWRDKTIHFSLGTDFSNHPDEELRRKWLTFVDYWHSGLLDWDWEEKIIGKALVKYLMDECKNLMIIPCFKDPLECDFNLFDLSKREVAFYFGPTMAEIYWEKVMDLRCGHLSPTNQNILAQQINQHLKPGIFQTDYSFFSDPIEPVEKLFSKNNINWKDKLSGKL